MSIQNYYIILWNLNTWISVIIVIHAIGFLCWYMFSLFLSWENAAFFIKRWNQSIKHIDDCIIKKTQPIFLMNFQILQTFFKVFVSPEPHTKATLVVILLLLLLPFLPVAWTIIYSCTKIFLYIFIVKQIREIIEQKIVPIFAIFILTCLIIIVLYLSWFVWLDNIVLFLGEPKILIFGYDVGSSLENDIYYFMGLLLIWIVLMVLVLLRNKQDRIFIDNN